MTLRAIVTSTSLRVKDSDTRKLYLEFDDVGLDMFPALDLITDILSDHGWEQTRPWVEIQDGWHECDVAKIPADNENIRRADLSVALFHEDQREGVSREIRPRVEAAIDFERDMRDRREFP